jgi:hypothetical protein
MVWATPRFNFAFFREFYHCCQVAPLVALKRARDWGCTLIAGSANIFIGRAQAAGLDHQSRGVRCTLATILLRYDRDIDRRHSATRTNACAPSYVLMPCCTPSLL